MFTDFLAALPLLITSTATLVVLLLAAFRASSRTTIAVAVVALLVAGIDASLDMFTPGVLPIFGALLHASGVASAFIAAFSFGGVIALLLSAEYLVGRTEHVAEYVMLVLASVVGMSMITMASDFTVLFLGIELMSISLYVLAGFFRTDRASNEASLKYFLLGAFATGFLLYGIALIYGAIGTTEIQAFVNCARVEARGGSDMMFKIGGILLFIGFAFKIAAVPFHAWAPDVYDGAPTPVAAFMSATGKTGALAGIVSIMANGAEWTIFADVLGALAIASMFLGNITAIAQTNVKRLLAYSSIAHAGYALVGVAAMNMQARGAVIFYAVVYGFMQLGAFGIVSLIEKESGENVVTLETLRGLGSRRPLLAALMAMFMISLAGIPPFAGFLGKYYLFSAAIATGKISLAIAGVAASFIGVFVYLRVIKVMYFDEVIVEIHSEVSSSRSLAITGMVFVAILLFVIGIAPMGFDIVGRLPVQ